MPQDIGVLIIGQGRIGKSFLANLLADTQFKSEMGPEAVTLATEWQPFTSGNGTVLHIFNIPGLLEADKAAIERNTDQARKAFKQFELSIVVYVFEDVNGSVSGEAVGAFMNVNDSFPMSDKTLLFVVNQWKGEPTDLRADSDLQSRTTAYIHRLTNTNAHVHFVPELGSAPQPADRQREQMALLREVLALLPEKHNEEKKPLNLNPVDEETKKRLEAAAKAIEELKQQASQKDESFEKLKQETEAERAKHVQEQKAVEDKLAQIQQAAAPQGGGGGGPFAQILGGIGHAADGVVKAAESGF